MNNNDDNHEVEIPLHETALAMGRSKGGLPPSDPRTDSLGAYENVQGASSGPLDLGHKFPPQYNFPPQVGDPFPGYIPLNPHGNLQGNPEPAPAFALPPSLDERREQLLRDRKRTLEGDAMRHRQYLREAEVALGAIEDDLRAIYLANE